MTDLRKVSTTLRPGLGSANRFAPPEGDRGVFYAKTGFLVPDLPVLSWTPPDIAADTLSQIQTKPSNSIIIGAYFRTAQTPLDVSAIDICRSIIGNDTGLAGNITHTLPTAPVILAGLKDATSYRDITPGTGWKWTYINDDNGSTVTLDFSAAGFTSFGTSSGGNTHVIAASSQATIKFLVTSTTPGSETITVFVTA